MNIFDNCRKRRYSASLRLGLRPGLGRDDACDRLASLLAGQGQDRTVPGVAWLGAMTPGLAAGSEALGQRTGAHLADGGELTAKVCVLPFKRRNLFIGHDRVLVLTVHLLIDVGRSSLALYPGTNPLTFLTCTRNDARVRRPAAHGDTRPGLPYPLRVRAAGPPEASTGAGLRSSLTWLPAPPSARPHAHRPGSPASSSSPRGRHTRRVVVDSAASEPRPSTGRSRSPNR